MWIWTLKVVRVFQLGINNNCYCCLHYPISYVLVSVLQSLLSDRKSSLSQNLYKMSQQIDAKLRKVGQDRTVIKISQHIQTLSNWNLSTPTCCWSTLLLHPAQPYISLTVKQMASKKMYLKAQLCLPKTPSKNFLVQCIHYLRTSLPHCLKIKIWVCLVRLRFSQQIKP